LEAQWRLNPIRLQMDKSSFPVATKDYANLLGLDVGAPILPCKPSDQQQMDGLKQQLKESGYID
jgi:4-hydroxy-tetrahydrodipicolinate synthase